MDNETRMAVASALISSASRLEEKEIKSFIKRYLKENDLTVKDARHGGCVDFAEAFVEEHSDAEIWETVEMEDSDKALPLVMSYEAASTLMKERGVDGLIDLGALGAHAVVVWRGKVFDAAGISSFDKITKEFDGFTNLHWFRTV